MQTSDGVSTSTPIQPLHSTVHYQSACISASGCRHRLTIAHYHLTSRPTESARHPACRHFPWPIQTASVLSCHLASLLCICHRAASVLLRPWNACHSATAGSGSLRASATSSTIIAPTNGSPDPHLYLSLACRTIDALSLLLDPVFFLGKARESRILDCLLSFTHRHTQKKAAGRCTVPCKARPPPLHRPDRNRTASRRDRGRHRNAS